MGTVITQRLNRKKGCRKNKENIEGAGSGDKVKSMTDYRTEKIQGKTVQNESKVAKGKQVMRHRNHPSVKSKNQSRFRKFLLKNTFMGSIQARSKWFKMLKKQKRKGTRVVVSNLPDTEQCAKFSIKMQKRTMPSPRFSTAVNRLLSPKQTPKVPKSLARNARIVTCESGLQSPNALKEFHEEVHVPLYIFAFRDKENLIVNCSPQFNSKVIEQLKSAMLDIADPGSDVQTNMRTSKNNDSIMVPSAIQGQFSVPAHSEDMSFQEDQPAPDHCQNDSVECMELASAANDLPGKEDKNVTTVDICTKLLVSKALLGFASDFKTYAETCIKFLSWSCISIQGDIDFCESNEDDMVNFINHCHDKVVILLEFLALLDRRQIINVDDSEICHIWLLHDAIICILQVYRSLSGSNASSSLKNHLVSLIIAISKMILPNENVSLEQWREFMKIVRGIQQLKLSEEKNLCQCSNLFAPLLNNRQCRLCEVLEFYEGTPQEKPNVEPIYPTHAVEPVELLFPRLSSFLRTIEEWSEEEYKIAITKHSYQRFLCNRQSCLYPCGKHLSQVFCSCFSSKQNQGHGGEVEGIQSHVKINDYKKGEMCCATVTLQVPAEGKSPAVETESKDLKAAGSATSSEDFHLQLDIDSESGSESHAVCSTYANKGSPCAHHSDVNFQLVEPDIDNVDSQGIMSAQRSSDTLVRNPSASDPASSETLHSTCLDEVVAVNSDSTEVISIVDSGEELALKSSNVTLSMMGNRGSISDVSSSLSIVGTSTKQTPPASPSPCRDDLSSHANISVATFSTASSSSGLKSAGVKINHETQSELSSIPSAEQQASKRKHEDGVVIHPLNKLLEDLPLSKQMKHSKAQHERPFRSKLSLNKTTMGKKHSQLAKDTTSLEKTEENFSGLKDVKEFSGNLPPNGKSILQTPESKESGPSFICKSVRFQDQMPRNFSGKFYDHDDLENSNLEDIAEQMLEAERNFRDDCWMRLQGKGRNGKKRQEKAGNAPSTILLKGKKKIRNLRGDKGSRVETDIEFKNQVHKLMKKYIQ